MRIIALGVLGLVTVALYVWHFRGERIRIARSEWERRRAAQRVAANDPELWPVFNSDNVDFSNEDEVM